MTHDELLATIRHRKTTSLLYTKELNIGAKYYLDAHLDALRAVVELHKPFLSNKFYAETLNAEPDIICQDCTAFQHRVKYPCRTIQAIEKELG